MLTLTVGTPPELEQALDPAVQVLSSGGVIAYPTDTLYGLGVDPRRGEAVARLFRIKDRPADAPVPLIAADAEQVGLAGDLPPLGRRLASRFWPGPLALVIRVTGAIDPSIHHATGTIAIRVPAHPVARALARGLGYPITATSANLTGHAAAATADEVRAALGGTLDLIVDGGAARGGAASTIVDVTQAEARLVRAGAVPWERVLEFLQSSHDA